MNRGSRKLPVLFEMDKSPGYNLLILKIFYTTISCGQGPNSIPSINPLSFTKETVKRYLKPQKKAPSRLPFLAKVGFDSVSG